METLAKLDKFIEGKLKLLAFTSEETARIVQEGDVKAMDRQAKALERSIDKIHEIKLQIQEIKIEGDWEPNEVRKWSEELEAKLSKYEKEFKTIKNEVTEVESKEKEKIEQEKRQRVFEDELKLQEVKLQRQFEMEKQYKEVTDSSSKPGRFSRAKLPKLVITPFQGTHLGWMRFWSQFETEIDKSEVSQVTKFSYLKELIIPKVRGLIDGLPYTTEGYERAKSVLKSKYGKPSEVSNAHMQCIISLPVIPGNGPSKIHEFYENLVAHVQVLETMGKLKEINGYVRLTLDKLPGIRADLVRLDDNWREWGFPQLVESLHKWCERNPITLDRKAPIPTPEHGLRKSPQKRERVFQTKEETSKIITCVYCESGQHKSVDCDQVKGVQERKKSLAAKKLCFNCTGAKHRAADCRSKHKCKRCEGKHHTSICDKQPGSNMMIAAGEGSVTYPVVVVLVDGIKCRALLDTGAGSSYASAALLERLNKRPLRSEYKRIDMMMHSTTQRIDVYNVKVQSIDGKFEMSTLVSKVDKGALLMLPNPRYAEIIKSYSHMKGVIMEDDDTKSELPVHLILGASEYSRIKTEEKPRLGRSGEPVAERTALGWTIMSPGKEMALGNMLFARSSLADYEQLCNIDVLGLEDRPEGDQSLVYEEFKEQLSRNQEGWYETGLLWKQNHDTLPSNEKGSIKRLQNLLKKLQKNPDLMEKYDDVIQDQLRQGIVEAVPETPAAKEFYIPHKPVVRETAETTKLRVVYDASAKETESSPSLNECLETGPPLQNLLWNVLVRSRFKPVALAGDIKQAFLQVRIRHEDRDVLRFHWIKDGNPDAVTVLRFTRAMFGLVQSPFLLAGTLQRHLDSLEDKYPKEVQEIKRSLYVDDIITGGETSHEVAELKETMKSIFGEAGFELHKWHSNDPMLEEEDGHQKGESQSFAKQQLGVKPGETKVLGLAWNKERDTIAVTFPERPQDTTKREKLRFLASIYDPLGVVAPVTLVGKLIYREVCDQRKAWDEKLSGEMVKRWLKFASNLPERAETPRSLAVFQEPIQSIDLHVFGDTSGQGTSAVVYAVVSQNSGTFSGLVCGKARLAKKSLTIPRLELVSAHMAANLVDNVRTALEDLPVRSVYGWLDSTVALYWIKGKGSYKQFVTNRVNKISAKCYITWRHVGTEDNPADIGSRGCSPERLDPTWKKGPDWLTQKDQWPEDKTLEPSEETETESKQTREVFGAAVVTEDEMDEMLKKHSYWKAVRITTWIRRFAKNSRLRRTERVTGPLKAEETQFQVKWWIRREQERYSQTERFKEDQFRLNLQKNPDGVYECRGRIQGSYPTYIPPRTLLAERMVQDAHLLTLHGGVGLTMSFVRQNYWIPQLRYLTKGVVTKCYGCKRFHTTAFQRPPPGNLPTDRTEGSVPFQTVGVDYAGPIMYKMTTKREGKAYILLFTCSLTRAVHIELLSDQSTEGFITALKRFIARRGRPCKIYSDNGRSFVGAERWLRKIMEDEKAQNYLAHQSIVWQFNLSRAPWWGGQFERLVGIVKQALYKAVGRAVLKWKELEEVMLDVEIAINNRPLAYVEDDVQLPVLTPNLMICGQPNFIPEVEADSVESIDLRKRAKYLRRCKDVLWSRWTKEYVRCLRERHNLKHNSKELRLKIGDVVLIQGDERNRGRWSIGIVEKLIKGRDGVVRAVRLRAGKSYLERAPQQLCPMELSCDRQPSTSLRLNPIAREFRPRMAAQAARQRVKEIMQAEEQNL